MCDHPIGELLGIADGIKCKRCGAVFATWAALEEDRQKTPQKRRKPARKDKAND